jgi:hypothetical protein
VLWQGALPNFNHHTGQDGWEEVADYVLDWALEHTMSAAQV